MEKKIENSIRRRVIVALDFKTMEEVEKTVVGLGSTISFYKVGLELFLHTDGKVIDYLMNKNKEVFLDLKFHDISNTVLNACKYAISKNVAIFNIHASNGTKTMELVSDLIKESGSKSKAIAVTMLTNLGDDDAKEMFGKGVNVFDLTTHLANLAYKSGMNGVVCSALEAKSIKDSSSKDFITVCPGIRPEGADVGDQKRVATPYEAIKNGADFLVIGRAITQADNPVTIANQVVLDINRAILEME